MEMFSIQPHNEQSPIIRVLTSSGIVIEFPIKDGNGYEKTLRFVMKIIGYLNWHAEDL